MSPATSFKQNYREGSVVARGEVLFEIDPRPFKAALDQAKAQLAQAEAQLGKARLDVERDTPLALDISVFGDNRFIQGAKGAYSKSSIPKRFALLVGIRKV